MFAYRTRSERYVEGAIELELELLVSFEEESARLYAHRARQGLSADPRFSPMFGVIWPSARLATRWIADCSPGERVLEIGCGLGLPSLVAARRGARVCATDNHPHAGPFLKANAARNQVEVEFHELGGEEVPEDPTWDRVIATDVLFAFDMPARIADAFARSLAPNGRGLLVDPGRPWLDAFLDEAEKRGLNPELTLEDVVDDALFAVALRR